MTESQLVERFAHGLTSHGLRTEDGVLRGFVVGSEIALAGASTKGNTGAADLLMVTEDGRWWLVEAKLGGNGESQPDYLFGNQLARYALALERIGLAGLHPRLESYLFGRRVGLMPPEALADALLDAQDLVGALAVWCRHRGVRDPEGDAERLLRSLEAQVDRRTITLAALMDAPRDEHRAWMDANADYRSLALMTMDGHGPSLAHARLASWSMDDTEGTVSLPPFDQIPQTYKPTPRTLPRLLSEDAYAFYANVLEPRLARWTEGAWPEVTLSSVTAAAFSLDLESACGREICLQIGRSDLADGAEAGMHPLKLIVNLIWAAERVYEAAREEPADGEDHYRAMEKLVTSLSLQARMTVRGVPRKYAPGGPEWLRKVRAKMRGDGRRRPELVVVRLDGDHDGYCWPDSDPADDRRLLEHALEAVEEWLGAPPYSCIARRKTARSVPGAV